MTREEARKILEDGGSIKYRVWTFTKRMYSCSQEECNCGDGFMGIDNAIYTLFQFAAGEEDQLKKL